MRILIDGSALLLPGGGVKSYVYYWLLHLRRMVRDPDRILVFPFLNSLGPLDHKRSNYGRLSTWIRLNLVRAANLPGNSMLDILGHHTDLFHESNTQVFNPPRNSRLTATIHDMTCWLMPELHVSANVAETKRFAKHVLARADRLVAPSHNTRHDAAEILHIPAERIEVIYHGVADDFFHVLPEQAARIASKYRLSRPYILFVGTLEPRKNVDTLINAYLQLPPTLHNEMELVIAGSMGWGAEHLAQRLQTGLPGTRWLGYVAEADLPGLTAGATVFVYPSLYEGFGLPVAQAMAAGVPVITSNVSSLPEITGDAAILVDPKNSEDIRVSLERVLLDSSLRRRLVDSGIRRASAYRWEACAAKSLEFFHSVC